MADDLDGSDESTGERVETVQFTMTMTTAQIERMRDLVDEGTTDQERVRILVSQALLARERALTPGRITDAVVAAIRQTFRTDEDGRVVCDDGRTD